MISVIARLWLLYLTLCLGTGGCQSVRVFGNQAENRVHLAAAERPVQVIPLTGEVHQRSAELSGMAWYKDLLILLPQYPSRFSNDHSGSLFTIRKARVQAFLDGTDRTPIEPRKFGFDDGGLSKKIERFEGFEAIAFDGDDVYVAVETPEHNGIVGYLVAGRVDTDAWVVRLDPKSAMTIPSKSGLPNMSDEAVVLTPEQIITIHEANGAHVQPNPVASVFDKSLRQIADVRFPTIEYRITDATAMDAEWRFWATNFFYPGDKEALKPAADKLVKRYGIGSTHSQSCTVERLVEFQISSGGITLTDSPPIQLRLQGTPRNWEGMARLDGRGFLLVTDAFPETMLGFVAEVSSTASSRK